ncbi:Zinc finger CCCH-type [Penicillium bovifimosum]|uniref:Zinc finger CCCH-type n=1 Tax=Penicillium bovifimosum TaxID=126998 RepID=A0A9W9L214_9EURO|nr:Zinc finger CCCH-type [Penicillium bovifimosum]KAJ5131207.1 Zinc finger CCCH-type [Penicillium bovifimosum]
MQASQTGTGSSDSKKRFNVDSPSFTPSLLSGAGVQAPKKSTAISPKAANAAPFQPRTTSSRSNTGTPTGRSDPVPDWAVADVQEFVPQGFEHAVSRPYLLPRVYPTFVFIFSLIPNSPLPRSIWTTTSRQHGPYQAPAQS